MTKLEELAASIDQMKADVSAAITKELGEVAAQIEKLKGSGNGATDAQLDALINKITSAGVTLVSAVDAISKSDGADDTTPTPDPGP